MHQRHSQYECGPMNQIVSPMNANIACNILCFLEQYALKEGIVKLSHNQELTEDVNDNDSAHNFERLDSINHKLQ